MEIKRLSRPILFHNDALVFVLGCKSSTWCVSRQKRKSSSQREFNKQWKLDFMRHLHFGLCYFRYEDASLCVMISLPLSSTHSTPSFLCLQSVIMLMLARKKLIRNLVMCIHDREICNFQRVKLTCENLINLIPHSDYMTVKTSALRGKPTVTWLLN